MKAAFVLLAVVALAMISTTSSATLPFCANQNPVSGNRLCDILCKVPVCGKTLQGSAKWFGNLCYLTTYNIACGTLYLPTNRTACPVASQPPTDTTHCLFGR